MSWTAPLQDSLTAMFALFFGAIALLLAAIGVYGLMSFAVNQRLREIAIRVALGADRTSVVRKVIGDGVGIAVVGLVGGGFVARSSVQIVKSLIFGVTPRDPLTIAGAAALLGSIAIVACLLPALRAARTDPTALLRNV